jgi:hypothetical protein
MKQVFDIPFKLNQEVYFRNKEGIVDERPFIITAIDITMKRDKKITVRYSVAPKDYPEWSQMLYGWGKEAIFASVDEAKTYVKDVDTTDGWLDDD